MGRGRVRLSPHIRAGILVRGRGGRMVCERFTKFGRFMSVTGVQERTIGVEGLRTRYLTAGDDGGRRWSCCMVWVPARASGPGCCPV